MVADPEIVYVHGCPSFSVQMLAFGVWQCGGNLAEIVARVDTMGIVQRAVGSRSMNRSIKRARRKLK
jgi:hypothetical protein